MQGGRGAKVYSQEWTRVNVGQKGTHAPAISKRILPDKLAWHVPLARGLRVARASLEIALVATTLGMVTIETQAR